MFYLPEEADGRSICARRKAKGNMLLAGKDILGLRAKGRGGGKGGKVARNVHFVRYVSVVERSAARHARSIRSL